MTTEALAQEDLDLAFTQEIRRELVKRLRNTNDPKEMNILLAALDGIDRNIFAQRKSRTDAGLSDKFGTASAAITHILTQLRQNTRDFAMSQVPTEPQVIALPEAPAVAVAPGELKSGDPSLNYETIMGTDPT